jgi:hypothetical protein
MKLCLCFDGFSYLLNFWTGKGSLHKYFITINTINATLFSKSNSLYIIGLASIFTSFKILILQLAYGSIVTFLYTFLNVTGKVVILHAWVTAAELFYGGKSWHR